MDKQVKRLLDMSGKVAVITGGFANLGFDIASALAEYGCMVVVTSRKIEKAQDAAARIQQSSGEERISVFQCRMQIRISISFRIFQWPSADM